MEFEDEMNWPFVECLMINAEVNNNNDTCRATSMLTSVCVCVFSLFLNLYQYKPAGPAAGCDCTTIRLGWQLANWAAYLERPCQSCLLAFHEFPCALIDRMSEWIVVIICLDPVAELLLLHLLKSPIAVSGGPFCDSIII